MCCTPLRSLLCSEERQLIVVCIFLPNKQGSPQEDLDLRCIVSRASQVISAEAKRQWPLCYVVTVVYPSLVCSRAARHCMHYVDSPSCRCRGSETSPPAIGCAWPARCKSSMSVRVGGPPHPNLFFQTTPWSVSPREDNLGPSLGFVYNMGRILDRMGISCPVSAGCVHRQSSASFPSLSRSFSPFCLLPFG